MDVKISRNFWRSEFACRCGCGFDTADIATVRVAQDLRDWAGAAVRITSGCRCASHNREVGGAPESQHVRGRAIDVVVDGQTPDQVADYLEAQYPDKYGIGRYETFTHVDTRSNGPARWGSNERD